MRKIRMDGRSSRGRWVTINRYSEDQPRYSAEDHAIRDARLFIKAGSWLCIEIYDEAENKTVAMVYA